jgi:hypothetical protein
MPLAVRSGCRHLVVVPGLRMADVEYVRFGRGLGGLAQLGERGVRNAEVEGSNPLPSTTTFPT